MENKNTKKTLVIVVSTLLALVGIVFEVLGVIRWNGVTPEFIAYIIVFVATIYYVLAGYKKPHGNLLRWTFLLIAFACLNGIIDAGMTLAYERECSVNILLFIIGLYGISVLLISYIAGRLDKIKKNYALLIVVSVALIIKSVLFLCLYDSWSNIVSVILNFSTFLLWIDLMTAYLIRYKEHKEAGLTDK